MRRVIQFDIDGVLADFVRGFVAYGYRLGVIEQPLDRVDPYPSDANNMQYGTEHLVGPTASKAIWENIHRNQIFWIELPLSVSRETMARIDRLQYDHVIYFATNRMGVRAKQQTQDWLELRGIHNPTVVLTAKKGKTADAQGATHAIEDKAGNAVYIAYESPGTRSFLLNRPYNRFDHDVLGSKVTRVDSVDEFLDHVVQER